LGPRKEFKTKFERSEDGTGRIRAILGINSEDGMMFRRDKEILRLNGELPRKIIHEPLYSQMSEWQEEQERFIVSSFRAKPFQVLQNLQKLYQHPYLLKEKLGYHDSKSAIADSPKLKATIEVLEAIKQKDEKVLVFTLWVRMQGLLQGVLKDYFGLAVDIINGETNAETGTGSAALEIIKTFSEKPGFNILILSPLAAGAGLNITAANHVIHYGRWWNPAKEDQSTDRAYRIGQKKDVHVYYPTLVTSNGGGFDKGLDQLARQKRATANDILAPVNGFDVDIEEILKRGNNNG
jgi:SNF2 family DNA or RNA helicase